MKKRRIIGWLAGAALMMSMGNCSDDYDSIAPEEVVNPAMEKYSTILLNVLPPGSPALTRADVQEGEVKPLEVGERIYSIKVWAFLSEEQTRRDVSYISIRDNGNARDTVPVTKPFNEIKIPSDLQMEGFVNNPIAYVEYENVTGNTGYQQLQLSIPSVVLENFWKLDLYATCNSQSYLAKTTDNPMGEITSHATRQQIEAAVIKHDETQTDDDRKDPFGVINPVRGTGSFVAYKGLPMSYIQKNIDFASNIVYDELENQYNFNSSYVQSIHLQRIVSKFHFVFTRSAGTVTEAEITKIEVGLLDNNGNVTGGAFPTVEYQMPKMGNSNVMPTRITNIGPAYEDGFITFKGENGAALLSTGQIMEAQDVYQYMATVDGEGKLYVNGVQMTAQAYDDLLLGASYDAENASSSPEGKELTMYGRTWIRETDKQLGGKIYYKINNDNVEHTATFQMAEAGDFSRNHLWIIYAYFEGGGLYVKPALLPWQHDEDTEAIEMETGVNINTTVYDDTWLKYTDLTTDPDTAYIAMSYSSEWAGTYDYTSLAISDNEVEYTGNPRTKTMNSPLMHVSYSTSRLIRMSRFAPHFLFLWVKATDANYDTDGNLTSVPTSGWKISRAISTNEAVPSGDIFFYVIPDKAFTPGVEARENIIVVSELSSASQLIPGNVGINNNVLLPGDITYIRFKYVTDYTEATTADYTIETVSSTTP